MLGLGLSLLTGGSVSPEYVKLSKAFVTRVEADGGTVDSFACLKTDMAYLTSNPDAPAGYFVEFSAATVGSSAEFRITLTGGAGYTYTYAVTDTQANEVTGTGVIGGDIQSVTADLSTLVDGTVTVAVYLSGAGGDGLIVTDTATLVGYTGLLDTYSGAAAAYSLRLLDTSYTGSAIKVRRSSDNAEQDIAFVNNELDTASLETFAGAGDAFVTTWYDQSGSGNNATQTNASAQPKIVSSGSTILENGKAAVQFDGSNDSIVTSSNFIANTDLSLFLLRKFNSTASKPQDIISQGATASSQGFKYGMSGGGQDQFAIYYPSLYGPTDGSTTTLQELHSLITTSSTTTLNINAASQSLSVSSGSQIGNNSDPLTIGQRDSGSGYFNGNIQELVIYTADKTTDESGIETNINDFYSIY